ncbi:MAG: 3-methyl-2-oxobutanoate dehydrogenase subunit VorB [Deltaproteobacteria bacterium]|nr:3-methyl-2-oxobutanoate dehydrogenase subunit VorB [Deltaproteobacteria bacterium]
MARKIKSEMLLVKGNEAVAMGAMAAGCRYYFGYPITPQNDIPEYMSIKLQKAGGRFIQADREIGAITMLMGAASNGARAMTSSSSPGISLKQEGLSYMAGSQVPGVVVNMSRSGPGLGGIHPSQGDYFQATRGGGHGDYRLLVLAPDGIQECYELTMLAFDLADKYRNPTMILGDAILGNMKESLTLTPYKGKKVEKPWALTGAKDRPPQFLKSLYLSDGELTTHNWNLYKKYQSMIKDVRVQQLEVEDAEMILVAFGSMARVLKSAVIMGRRQGLKIGLIRPITLYPFPAKQIKKASETCRHFLTMELNTGQMVEDVKLSVEPGAQVDFFGIPPGSIPSPDELMVQIKKFYKQK